MNHLRFGPIASVRVGGIATLVRRQIGTGSLFTFTGDQVVQDPNPVRTNLINRQRRLLPEAKPIEARRIVAPIPPLPHATAPVVPSVSAAPESVRPVPVQVNPRVSNLLVDVNRTPGRISNLLVDINRDKTPIAFLTRPALDNALDEEVPTGEPGGDPETDLLRAISRQASAALGGDPARTISSQLGQRQIEGRAGILTNTICAGLNVVDRDHCLRSFRSEIRRAAPAGRIVTSSSASANFIGWTPAYGRRIASEIRRGRISCR